MSILGLKVNGKDYEVEVGLRTTLLQVLRDKLLITSPKVGCNTGDCGSCSVLLNGLLVRSCITNALSAQGKEVLTLEGLGEPGTLHPLQKAFYEYDAAQCGFCTSGMILSAKALLDKKPRPTKQEIREALSGNLCRCTGYFKIIKAVMAAAKEMQDNKSNKKIG